MLLKVVFYLGFHPWADVILDDFKSIKSWKSPSKEPIVGNIKGPRKSKCLAICDRIYEGLFFEGSICNTGAIEDEDEEKGNYISVVQLNVLCLFFQVAESYVLID